MKPASLISNVLGVIVIARNGDRQEYYQDPQSYSGRFTETTALGEVQSHQLGSFLRETYLNPGSSSFINDIETELVNNQQMAVQVKGGGEGTVVFDSAIALLQGLWPPTKKNQITLANDTVVTAPMGGYQYVPLETINPANDRSLESWTDCPKFQDHISKTYESQEFKQKEREAEPFFNGVRDFVFGRQLKLANIWNIHDYISSELTHNKTYAYRLPPSYAEQARGLADWVEDRIFANDDMNHIANIAGRTLTNTIIESLGRIAYNGDPLQFHLIETTYQPFLSLFHQTQISQKYPELKAIPDYASALAIELRRGAPPDSRDFLRFRFRNGTGDFQTHHVFNHDEDIPLTEFIYKIQGSAIRSQAHWAQVCGANGNGHFENVQTMDWVRAQAASAGFASSAAVLVGVWLVAVLVRRMRTRYVRLPGDETIAVRAAEKRVIV